MLLHQDFHTMVFEKSKFNLKTSNALAKAVFSDKQRITTDHNKCKTISSKPIVAIKMTKKKQ